MHEGERENVEEIKNAGEDMEKKGILVDSEKECKPVKTIMEIVNRSLRN